jgi:hypothetical protein
VCVAAAAARRWRMSLGGGAPKRAPTRLPRVQSRSWRRRTWATRLFVRTGAPRRQRRWLVWTEGWSAFSESARADQCRLPLHYARLRAADVGFRAGRRAPPAERPFCAAARRAAAGDFPAAALRTRVMCNASSTLNVSRRKSVQPRVQEMTERMGRVDSTGGSNARQLRRRRGLSCRAKHHVDAMSAPAQCAGASGRRNLPKQHARHRDPACAPHGAPLKTACASSLLSETCTSGVFSSRLANAPASWPGGDRRVAPAPSEQNATVPTMHLRPHGARCAPPHAAPLSAHAYFVTADAAHKTAGAGEHGRRRCGGICTPSPRVAFLNRFLAGGRHP